MLSRSVEKTFAAVEDIDAEAISFPARNPVVCSVCKGVLPVFSAPDPALGAGRTPREMSSSFLISSTELERDTVGLEVDRGWKGKEEHHIATTEHELLVRKFVTT